MNKLDAALNFHQTVLRVRNQRQEILASNIANADTPQYKARDIDFAAAMTAALQPSAASSQGASNSQNGGRALQATDDGHFKGTSTASFSSGGDATLFRPVIQGSVDGNSVDLDVERNAFTDNAVRYEASLTMMTGQIKKMLSAISGQ